MREGWLICHGIGKASCLRPDAGKTLASTFRVHRLTVAHGPASLHLVKRELRPFVRGAASLIDSARRFARAKIVLHHAHNPAIRDTV